jgi:hypothetical protein
MTEQAQEAAILNCGEICLRLGFTVTAVFIEQTLGVPRDGVSEKRKTPVWNESSWPHIKAEMVRHLIKLPE